MTLVSRRVDLNADLGEGFSNDEALLERVTSASVCCGAYASDEATIARTLALAARRGVVVGAHPGFPDREHFGRREWSAGTVDVTRLILEQCTALAAIARGVGASVRYVKPHGALYNQAQRDRSIAEPVVGALVTLRCPLLGQSGSVLETLAREAGVDFIAEGFPERRYSADGRLVPRSAPDSVLHDAAEIGAQAVRLVERGVRTLCIHGDDPAAVDKADVVAAALRDAGIGIRSFLESEAV